MRNILQKILNGAILPTTLPYLLITELLTK